MEYAKLTIRKESFNSFYQVVDIKTDGKRFYETIRNKKRAQRLVKCWNEYDSLKAKADVCDELVEALKKAPIKLERDTLVQFHNVYKSWCRTFKQQALAKAERIK